MLILPSVPELVHEYQIRPSPASVMPEGPEQAGEFVTSKCVITPAGVIRPILFVPFSVNQMLPSGPVARNWGALPTGSGNSLITAALAASLETRIRSARVFTTGCFMALA